MYVITRSEQEQIVFEDGTVITLVKAKRGKASLGVELPSGKRVYRAENCPFPITSIVRSNDSDRHKARNKGVSR